MPTPESKIKKLVVAVLKRHGAYYECPVPTGFGKSGLDFSCCFHGLAFYIETKAPGKKPTPRQLLTIKDMLDAGAMVFVIDGDTAMLESWLEVYG